MMFSCGMAVTTTTTTPARTPNFHLFRSKERRVAPGRLRSARTNRGNIDGLVDIVAARSASPAEDDCLVIFVDDLPLAVASQQTCQGDVRRNQHCTHIIVIQTLFPVSQAVISAHCFSEEHITIN